MRREPVADLARERRLVIGVGQVHRRNGSGLPLTSRQMSSFVTTDGREVRTRGQKTRARLLQAGAQVFGTKGFHTARVDDIVRAAKTSHGTFYVYFPSKEALLDELLTQIGHEMAELVADLPDLRSTDGDGAWCAAGLVGAVRRLLRPIGRGPAVVDGDRVRVRQRSRHAGSAQRRERPARRAGRSPRAQARRALARSRATDGRSGHRRGSR